MYHIFFILSSTDGHFGCFCILDFVNRHNVNFWKAGYTCIYMYAYMYFWEKKPKN